MTRLKVAEVPDLVTSSNLLDASDLLVDGFPSADLVPLVLAQVPGQVVPSVRRGGRGTSAQERSRRARVLPREAWVQPEGPQGRVRLSAGTVGLAALDEARAERSRTNARLPAALSSTGGETLRVGQSVELVDGPGFVDIATGEIVSADWEATRVVRGRITEWSGKSRANLIRRMAATDWQPMFRLGFAPMTTLTYPGPWTAFAPSRAVVGRHLESFKEAYRREFMLPLGLPVMGAWKVEYQRRGAPHLHLLLPVPPSLSVAAFRTWVGETWVRIVWDDRGGDLLRLLSVLGHDSDGAALIAEVHRERHEAAGTAVDFAEGARLRDPRRIALYFLGHSLAHAADGGKEYQHRLPAAYAGRAGRWWGVWGLPDTTRDVFVTAETWWAMRDALAAYCEAQGRAAFQGGRMFGGWVAVNDGPETLLRLLEGVQGDDPTSDG